MTITNSIGTASRDYASIDLWQAAIPGTLVDAMVGQCYNDSQHTFYHLTKVERGKVAIYARKGGKPIWEGPIIISAPPTEFSGSVWQWPSFYTVPSGVFHTIIAIDGPAEFSCIYPNRNEIGEPIELPEIFPGWLKNFQ